MTTLHRKVAPPKRVDQGSAEQLRSGLTLAVNYLAASPHYERLKAELFSVLTNWHMYPSVYTGDAAVLNPLINQALDNFDGFKRTLRLIEQRRKAQPESKRAEYQRRLMNERRQRVYKAVELHTLMKHADLTREERAKYVREVQALWADAKARYILAQGPLTWKERNVVIGEFWRNVDETLDANLRAEKLKRTLH